MKKRKKITNNQPTYIPKNEYVAKILVGLCLFLVLFLFIDHRTAVPEYHVGIVTNKSNSPGTNKRPEKLYLTVKIENGDYMAFACKPEKYYATEINQPITIAIYKSVFTKASLYFKCSIILIKNDNI